VVGIPVFPKSLETFERALAENAATAREAMRLALNDVARDGAGKARKRMASQVAFPAGYLRDPRRFGVTQFATDGNLVASITGRGRATSLATFARGGTPLSTRRSGVTVRVSPSRSERMPGAFLVSLRSGTQDSGNIGLAIRLKAGDRIKGKHQMKSFGGGLYLLYGPSVDQVFKSVAPEIAPELGDELAAEFNRQYARLLPFGGK